MAVNQKRKFDDSHIFWGVLLIVGGGKLQNIEDSSLVILGYQLHVCVCVRVCVCVCVCVRAHLFLCVSVPSQTFVGSNSTYIFPISLAFCNKAQDLVSKSKVKFNMGYYVRTSAFD